MLTWMGRRHHPGYREKYLAEFLCWEGWGSAEVDLCPSCVDEGETRDWDVLPVMRCDECGLGLVECVRCCVA